MLFVDSFLYKKRVLYSYIVCIKKTGLLLKIIQKILKSSIFYFMGYAWCCKRVYLI